jgi:CBS domain-containing membrane protein
MSTLGLRRPASLRARDLLVRDLATIPDTASLASAWSLMRHLDVRHLPVLGPGGLVGLLHGPFPASGAEDGCLLDHLTRDVPEAHLSDDLEQVAALLGDSPCDAVVVLDDARHLLGVITSVDLAAAVAAVSP